jgi:hypothetical protein
MMSNTWRFRHDTSFEQGKQLTIVLCVFVTNVQEQQYES